MRTGFMLLGLLVVLFASGASAQQPFIRGDCNADGAIDIGDAVQALDILFSQGGPEDCTDACDANDDGAFDIGDAIFKLGYLFSMGPDPMPPFPSCGFDSTADLLDCVSYDACSAPPSAPVLDPFGEATNAATITITGVAPDGTTVEVVGPQGVLLFPTSAGTFSAEIPLVPNIVNHLFFTAIDTLDQRSAPTPTSVTQDSNPPELFIDVPGDGDELLLINEVTVVGRVSDLLSGFAGLTVDVNGLPASIAMGGGAFATFQATGIPLNVGMPTLITAVATDGLGNSATVDVTVTRTEPAMGEPFIEAISGSEQSAPVLSELGAPLVVQVTDGSGVPFANKLVSFQVTRSDGTVAETSGGTGGIMAQVLTDAAGLAQVFWTLGTDSGSGNNRVEATSAGVSGVATFLASGEPGPVGQINIGSGNGQQGEAGEDAPLPLDVFVHDGLNGVPNVPITFAVIQGGGLVDGASQATVMTGPVGHAEVVLTLGAAGGNNRVEANYPGNPNLPATFTVSGIVRDLSQPTRLSGIVLNNAAQPIQGVTCTLEVGNMAVASVVSAADGTVLFSSIPGGGAAHLLVDGSTATAVGGMPIPGSFPDLAYEIVLVPNAENELPAPILLPNLDPANTFAYSTTSDVEMTVVGLEGISLLVAAGSMSVGGMPAVDGAPISVNQVQTDSVPMPPPDGAAPAVVFTLQPANAHFDPPIRLVYPNVQGLQPGAVVQVSSFDHDTGQFEIVGSGQVTEDGSRIISDPGSGLPSGGWHYFSGRNGPLGRILGNAQVDLDENCTAAVNTDIVFLESDGSFELFTPVNNLGGALLQVLIVCNDGNSVLYGVSEWFSLGLGETYRINPVVLSPNPPPLPEFITLTAADGQLDFVGDTEQLTTIAQALDGSSFDVTLAAQGTQYTSSNPSIATVSADGLVTATGAGEVFITATNSGTAAVISLFSVPTELTTAVGIVREDDGTPVVGASVTLSVGGALLNDTTDPDGAFSIAGVPVGNGPLTVVAEANLMGTPFLSAPVTLGGVGGGVTDFGILTVQEALTDVIGIVHDPNGMPFENATVVVSAGSFTDTTMTLIDGSFQFLDVPTNQGLIGITATGDFMGSNYAAVTSATPITGSVTDVGVLVLQPLIPGFSGTSASGPMGSQVGITVRFGNTFGDVYGWSFGLCHDQVELGLVAATEGADIPTINNGNPPDFVTTDVWVDGVTHGCVIDLFAVNSLAVGEQFNVVDAVYQVNASPGTVSTLCFCGTAGLPMVEIIAVNTDGTTFVPPTTCTSITVTP